jgi:hypothetical protein
MELADEVKKLAIELALSGHHIDCLTIELQLADAGHPEVYVVLRDPVLRAQLKVICEKHWHPPATKRQ